MLSTAIVFCCLTVPFIDGCQNTPRNPKNRVAVISEMANAAAKGDFANGVAIGENYLRDNPGDRNVLQQTAILILAEAKNGQDNREPLVDRAVSLLEKSVNGIYAKEDDAELFNNRFVAARAFESAGDLSSRKCVYYRRALALNKEAATALTAKSIKLGDGTEVSTTPLKEQTVKLNSELDKRVSESQCGEQKQVLRRAPSRGSG